MIIRTIGLALIGLGLLSTAAAAAFNGDVPEIDTSAGLVALAIAAGLVAVIRERSRN